MPPKLPARGTRLLLEDARAFKVREGIYGCGDMISDKAMGPLDEE